MLRDNWSNFYDTYQCYGGTYWPPSAGSTDTGVGKVGGTSPLEFGVLVLSSPQSRTELARLQKSDPTFNMGVDIMKPVFNLDPKNRVTKLTREEGTRGPGTPAVKGLVWFTDGSRTVGGTGAGVCEQSVGRRLSISLGKHATVFQVEV